MITALDTNVILSLFNQEITARNVGWNLEQARKEGGLVMAPVVYVELSAHPAFTQQAIDEFLQNTGIQVTWDLGEHCWKLTALAHRHHWELRRKSGDKNKVPKRPVADTLVGAHASVHADRLFTMNVEDYRARFPELKLVDPSKLPLLPHQVVDEDADDTPIKTYVNQRITVDGPCDEVLLEHLLVTLYTEISQRDGFKYHPHPNSVYLWVYGNQDAATGRGEAWLAMLAKPASEPTYRLDFNPQRIRMANRPGEGSFDGRFFEDERKAIFKELVTAERRAMDEAEKELGGPAAPGFGDLWESKKQTYKQDLCQQHNITLEELGKIQLEGIQADWPFPER